jgi:hypothetical protein
VGTVANSCAQPAGSSLKNQIMNQVKRFVWSYRPAMDAITNLRRMRYGAPARGMVAMLYVGRSGSTVLASLLAQHPQIRWGAELFADTGAITKSGFRPTQAWVRSLIEFSAYRSPCQYFGFETQLTQLGTHCIPMNAGQYVAFLAGLGFSHFIVLTRSNLLKVVISALVAARVGALHAAVTAATPTRVRLDPVAPWGSWAGSLIEILDAFQKFYSDLDIHLSAKQALTLNYEADIEHGPNIGYEKVCGFLDIRPERVEIRLARTNPFSVAQLLTNFDEVATALRGTRFEWMLME